MAEDASGQLQIVGVVDMCLQLCAETAQVNKSDEAAAWFVTACLVVSCELAYPSSDLSLRHNIALTALASMHKLELEVPSTTMRRKAIAETLMAINGERALNKIIDIVPTFDELIQHEALPSATTTKPKAKGRKSARRQVLKELEYPAAINELRYVLRIQVRWQYPSHFYQCNHQQRC
jgi:hypothetical protein